jgi:isopentenyl-diphosphate delta-isomerase
MAEQTLLLVDDKDKFSGRYALKGACHTGKGLHHRAFTILICNKKGEVLLQKRKHRLWDGCWDLTSSHPLHKEDGTDETYQQAAQRCLQREWNFSVPVKKLFGFNYFARFKNFCENEYCALLLGEYNGEINPNPEVAYGYKWVLLSELLKKVKIQPQKYTPWLIKALEEYEKRGLD